MDFRPPTAPLRSPAYYSKLDQAPQDPRFQQQHQQQHQQYPDDQYYSNNADIQDDPYAQNPNLAPSGHYGSRSYAAPLTNYDPAFAASTASFDQPRAGLHQQYPSDPNYPYNQYQDSHSNVNVDSTAGFHNYGVQAPYGGYTDDAGRLAKAPRPMDDFAFSNEKRAMYDSPRDTRRRRWKICAIVTAVLIVLIGAGVAVYVFVIKPKMGSSSVSSSSGTKAAVNGTSTSTKGSGKGTVLVTTGGDGSKVTMADGTTFTYTNPFGGFWISDPAAPLNNNAMASSYSPPLNTSWNFGTDRIRGVNIGGWLVLEPFITPALFEKYPGTVDEFTLSTAMRADTAGGGINQIEDHYKTFITEQDFAEIAGAGLNWVRIPLPFWAIETWDGEPYLAKVGWTYFLQAIQWARKYGLRINLDFHAVPGSQNGWNHSGHLGNINFLNGIMGMANAQRSLTYIQILAQFISQPQYINVIPIFGIINEALVNGNGAIGLPQIQSFYLEAYQLVRAIGGVGTGNGPMISIHDGFGAQSSWAGIYPNADRLALDSHLYFAFGGASAAPLSSFIQQPCTAFQPSMTTSLTNFGMTFAGEFSLAINDCGLNVNGVGLGTRFEGTFGGGAAVGSCAEWDVWENYNDTTKQQLKQFALMEMDAMQNWFFWTWKIGNSTAAGSVRAPFWSYQLGLQQGWMPTDPTTSDGMCGTPGFTGPLASYAVGGANANAIPAATLQTNVWPPATIAAAGPSALLPQYAPTGPLPVVPSPNFTGSGTGIANPQFTMGAYVPVAGCTYYNEYDGVGAPLPTVACPAT